MATEELQIIIKSKAQGDGAKKTKDSLEGLKKAAAFAASAFAVLKTAQAALDFVAFGAGVQRQTMALDGLAKSAGSSAAEITSAIQGASDFTIDRMTAMSAASKAMMLDVAKTPEKFEQLTKVATSLGRAMGQDAAKSIDDFVVAAGRQSMQIADNLGLTIKAEQAYARYAKENNKLASALTSAEKKQAFLNEMLAQGEAKMAEMGDTSGGTAADLERMNAALADLKAAAAESAAALTEQTGVLEWLSNGLRELPTYLSQTGTLLKAAGEAALASGGNVANMATAIDVFESSLRRQILAQLEFNTVSEESRYAHLQNADAADADAKALESFYQYQELSKLGLENSKPAFDQYTMAINMSMAAQDAAAVSAAAYAAEQAELNAIAGEAAQVHANLAESLKGASEAQIASAAISQLGLLLQDGKISAADYALAVQETQLSFGLADEASINLSNRLMTLVTNFGEGKVGAGEFDESLAHLVDMNTSENLQLEKFGMLLADMPVPVSETTTAIDAYNASVDESAIAAVYAQSVIERQRAAMSGLDEEAVLAAANIRAFRDAIEAIPAEKTVTIRVQQIKEAVEESSPGANVPDFTMARGGWARSGVTLVGERGPELVELPTGARVYNNTDTIRMMEEMAGVMGGRTLDSSRGNLTIPSRTPSIPTSGWNSPQRGAGGGTVINYYQNFYISAAAMDAHELATELKREERLGGTRKI